MPTATKAPASDPLSPMRDALNLLTTNQSHLVPHLDAALRAAVRAVVPGRQQKKNLTPLLDDARKAFVRTLRRRAKS